MEKNLIRYYGVDLSAAIFNRRLLVTC